MIEGLEFKDAVEIPSPDLETLYSDNGWSLYTRDMPTLVQAFRQSLYVLSVWKDEELIGLIRLVGDGLTIIYVLDILILTNYQGQGIGTELMDRALAKFRDVRQKVLLTGEDPKQHRFYTRAGFKPVGAFGCTAFMRNDI